MTRVHFIGICGTAMATLAAMLKTRGLDVQGSDHGVYPPMSDFLAREQIRVFDKYDAANITSEMRRLGKSGWAWAVVAASASRAVAAMANGLIMQVS